MAGKVLCILRPPIRINVSALRVHEVDAIIDQSVARTGDPRSDISSSARLAGGPDHLFDFGYGIVCYANYSFQ